MALSAGSFIDGNQRFEVVRLLGQGGMASVYEVLDHATVDKRAVALKLASSEPSVRESAKNRLTTEFQVARNIASESVVRVLEFGETSSGVPFFTMEIAQGEPLASWIQKHSPPNTLPLVAIVKLLVQIAKAVETIHDAGFVFADLTPANIFVSEKQAEFQVTLIDLGLACKSVPFEASDNLSISQHGSLVGTKTHISPEQVRGEPLTNRTDIYAFGIVAFQVCTGELPYQMDNPLALIANQAISKTPSVRARNPAIPRSLETIIQVAMEKSPADRFSTMGEVIECLQKVGQKSLRDRLIKFLGFRSAEDDHQKSTS